MQVAPPGSNALSSPILYHRPPRRVYSQSSQKTAQLFGGEGADLAEQGSTSPSFTGFPCAPPMLPSQSQGACAPCDSSPAGGAKCQPVGKGQVSGKEKPGKTSPYHKLWAGERTCTCLPRGGGGMSRQRHAGEGSKNTKTMRGPAFRPAPARDPIFRDAMFLLFWCDQQQKVFHLSSHRKGCAHRQSLVTRKHLIIKYSMVRCICYKFFSYLDTLVISIITATM